MRSTLWLIFLIFRQMGRELTLESKRILASGRFGWRDLLKWLVFEKMLVRAYALAKTIIRMRVVNVEKVEVNGLSADMAIMPEKRRPYFVEGDFNQQNIFKEFKPTAKRADYRIVSFYNGPAGVSMLDVMLIALVRGWRPASVDEIFSLVESKDMKKYGFRDNYSLAAPATIIRRSSAMLSFCIPVISVHLIEKEFSKDNRTTVNLFDLLDNYPSGAHLLFRAS